MSITPELFQNRTKLAGAHADGKVDPSIPRQAHARRIVGAPPVLPHPGKVSVHESESHRNRSCSLSLVATNLWCLVLSCRRSRGFSVDQDGHGAIMCVGDGGQMAHQSAQLPAAHLIEDGVDTAAQCFLFGRMEPFHAA